MSRRKKAEVSGGEEEAAESPIQEAPANRKRGQPRGSANRAKTVDEATAPRRRGRPKGSKNRPKEVAAPRKRRHRKPVVSPEKRIDAMLKELQTLKAEIVELRTRASRYEQVRSIIG